MKQISVRLSSAHAPPSPQIGVKPAKASSPSGRRVGVASALVSMASNSFAALESVGDDETVATSSLAVADNTTDSSASSQDGGEKASRKGEKLRNPLVWVDLEMTGLDVERDTIIEVACIITDGDLKREVMGPATAIHADDSVLDSMNEWCKEHHGKSGLTQRVRESTVTMAQAEEALLAFISEHTQENMAQLAGNSIHVDRMFLLKHMPRVVAYLNYRIVDVSSIKELARRWFPKAHRAAPRKKLAHTALSDIKESIEELRYFRKAVFKSPNQCK
ncbi:hypothetical protein PLESTB_000501600 [Pleodorina starrii]|uniref:Exonuclease domain-containing protein n=1 Tax=Pleodorina starrii TaxID=330485 RepID=A0A9W6BGN2_9CHLO|nr:hypothetical protein PLESTM_001775000 [Pleodorina starrii]GLC51430.1 hypothetical protein PLESTB_000501600 [Pleodorina starrii]GLC67753.1 hypothetical protein PLESTF_000601900 [Pleodorina starrii]